MLDRVEALRDATAFNGEQLRVPNFTTSAPFGALALIVALAAGVPALATTFTPSQTYKSGTKIACVLDEHLDSSKLSYGDTFKLHIVDTSYPALNGSEILGYITDVQKPSGGNQGRVGFS